jgi:hypothetical protein
MPRVVAESLQAPKSSMLLREKGPFCRGHINGRLGCAWLVVCSCPCFPPQLVPVHLAFPFESQVPVSKKVILFFLMF